MGWSKQPVLPAGGPVTLNVDDTSRVVANTTADSMVAEAALNFPAGVPDAGDLVVIEAHGIIVNTSGISRDITLALKTGPYSGGYGGGTVFPVFTTAATAVASAADARPWYLRVAYVQKAGTACVIAASFLCGSAAAASVWGPLDAAKTFVGQRHDIAMDHATQTQALWLGVVLGSAHASFWITHRATRTLLVPTS